MKSSLLSWELVHQLNTPIPRTYKREAHKVYVRFTKKPRRSAKETRYQVKAQLQYVRRDLRYVHEFHEQGGQLPERQLVKLETIQQLFEQQNFMYQNKTHRVKDRIVSLSQPYVRPIKRDIVACEAKDGLSNKSLKSGSFSKKVAAESVL